MPLHNHTQCVQNTQLLLPKALLLKQIGTSSFKQMSLKSFAQKNRFFFMLLIIRISILLSPHPPPAQKNKKRLLLIAEGNTTFFRPRISTLFQAQIHLNIMPNNGDILEIQCSINLIHDIQRRRFKLMEGKHQGQRAQCLFST